MNSYLKWVGGKARVMDQITPHLPEGSRLVEPFVGSGAVFLNTSYKEYLLSDTNKDLITLHTAVRDSLKRVIKDTKELFKHNDIDTYYKLRSDYNRSEDAYERAVIFLYLNRHGFNGLMRYNLKGQHNVAYGYYKNVYYPETELTHFNKHSQSAVFVCQSFEETLSQVKKDDVVFCDPPYVPLNYSSNFTQYNKEPFNMVHQVKLKELLANLADTLQIPVFATNSDNQAVKDLYKGFTFEELDINRLISCKAESRQKIVELMMHK